MWSLFLATAAAADDSFSQELELTDGVGLQDIWIKYRKMAKYEFWMSMYSLVINYFSFPGYHMITLLTLTTSVFAWGNTCIHFSSALPSSCTVSQALISYILLVCHNFSCLSSWHFASLWINHTYSNNGYSLWRLVQIRGASFKSSFVVWHEFSEYSRWCNGSATYIVNSKIVSS